MFELTERQGLVVRVLRHYGRIQYVSKHFHYVMMYVNHAQVAKVLPEIKQLRNVKRVELSPWQTLDPDVVDLKSTGLYKSQDEDE